MVSRNSNSRLSEILQTYYFANFADEPQTLDTIIGSYNTWTPDEKERLEISDTKIRQLIAASLDYIVTRQLSHSTKVTFTFSFCFQAVRYECTYLFFDADSGK